MILSEDSLEAANSSMPAISIRACQNEDLDELIRLGRQTFYETFHAVNTPENMQAYLDSAFDPERIAAELNDPGIRYDFLFKGAELAGYVKLNLPGSQTDHNDPESLEIERIYVRREFQGQGLGRALIEHALRFARQAGMKTAWLGVWQENTAAIGFYQRMGFQTFATHDFWLGDERQTDDLMQLELN
jgi:ribosomal protein S18 acetylase RimI-like enzyme